MSVLAHPKVSQFTREIGSELGLESSFLDFVFSKARPDCFRDWCRDADNGWTCYVPDDVIVAYPLWSTNSDQILLVVSESEISYAMGFHDHPNIKFLSKTSQGLLADLLSQMWDVISEVEMGEAIEFCKFMYSWDLFVFVRSFRKTEEGVSWKQNRSSFIADVDLWSKL